MRELGPVPTAAGLGDLRSRQEGVRPQGLEGRGLSRPRGAQRRCRFTWGEFSGGGVDTSPSGLWANSRGVFSISWVKEVVLARGHSATPQGGLSPAGPGKSPQAQDSKLFSEKAAHEWPQPEGILRTWMSSQGWEPSQAEMTQDSLAPHRPKCAGLFSMSSGGQQRPVNFGETEEKAGRQEATVSPMLAAVGLRGEEGATLGAAVSPGGAARAARGRDSGVVLAPQEGSAPSREGWVPPASPLQVSPIPRAPWEFGT